MDRVASVACPIMCLVNDFGSAAGTLFTNCYASYRARRINWKLVATALNSGCLAPVAVLSAEQLHGRQEEFR